MNLQLVIFVVSALAVGAFGHGHHGRYRHAVNKCINSTEVDIDVLKAWHHKEHVDDERLKCFVACIMKTLGSMNEDGQVIPEKLIERLPMDVRDRETKVESIQICSMKKGEDDCDTAFQVAMCLRRHRVFERRNSTFWKNVQKCKHETKVDLELLRAERHGEEINDQQVKCFYACMMKKLNMMNDEGKINIIKLINRIPEDDEHREQKIEMMSMCAKKKGEDECDTAYRVRKCIHKGMMKMFRSNPITTTSAPPAPMKITSDNE